MTNTIAISDRLVFVCYQACTGGENFSVQMSELSGFSSLNFYSNKEGRTVITNEYFDKHFLRSGKFNEAIIYADTVAKSSPPKELQVIPSHYDYDKLLPYFPNSRFIRILSPTTELGKQKVIRNMYKKLWLGRMPTFAEFYGWCTIYITRERFEELVKQNYIKITMNFGQLHCVFENREPTKENVKKLFRDRISHLLFDFEPADHPQVLDVLPTNFKNSQELVEKFLFSKS